MLTAKSGPDINYGFRNPAQYGALSCNNPDIAPSGDLGGRGIFDPRVGYNNTRKGWIGMGFGYWRVLSQVPSTKATANIAALAHVVSATPMTLVTSTGAGVTYVATATTIWSSGNVVPVASLALDGLPALRTNFGIAQVADPAGLYKTSFYDAGTLLARCVSISGVSGGAGGNFIVNGADVYGYPMTQLITVGAGANTVNSTKAFKFIYSVVPQFTDAHNYSVGTADIFGLPLQSTFFHDALIWWNETLITANTGFTAADATSPATNATGDVRGTYAVQDASDGTKRLTFAQSLQAAGCIVPNGAVSMFGITQV